MFFFLRILQLGAVQTGPLAAADASKMERREGLTIATRVHSSSRHDLLQGKYLHACGRERALAADRRLATE